MDLTPELWSASPPSPPLKHTWRGPNGPKRSRIRTICWDYSMIRWHSKYLHCSMFTLQIELCDKMWLCETWHKTRTLSRVVGWCQSFGKFTFSSVSRSFLAKSSSTSRHQPAHMTTNNVKALTFAMRCRLVKLLVGAIDPTYDEMDQA